MSLSDHAAIWHIISPDMTTSSCYDTPDTCFTDIHVKDEDWLQDMPWSCPDGYEEAGSYIANEGIDVSLEGNDLAREAVNQLRGLPFGTNSTNNQDHCTDEKPFRFIKFRACTLEGSSCLPNGIFDVNTDVYYNLFTHNHPDGGQMLGAGNGTIRERKVTELVCPPPAFDGDRPPCYEVEKVIDEYNEGGLKPGNEIAFNSHMDAWKEPNQWRFERQEDPNDVSSNQFYLINRWTGQYLGSQSVTRKGATDIVGSSVLEKENALLVSFSQTTCSGDGTITLSGPLEEGQEFKKGREGTLYLTANNVEQQRRFEGCYYLGVWPSCPAGYFPQQDEQWCGLGGRKRWCETSWQNPEPKHQQPLQFHLREVVNHVSPESTHGREALEEIERAVVVNSSKDTSTAAIESFVYKFLWDKSGDLKEIFFPSDKHIRDTHPSPSPNPPSQQPPSPSPNPPSSQPQRRRPTTTRTSRLKSSYRTLRRSNGISDLSQLMGKPLKRSNAIADLGEIMQLEDANKILRRQNAMFFTESASSAVGSVSMPKLRSSGKSLTGLMSTIGTIAGPALSIGFIFVSAYFEYKDEVLTEERFRKIENAINELAVIMDAKFEEVLREVKGGQFASLNEQSVGYYNQRTWISPQRAYAMEVIDAKRRGTNQSLENNLVNIENTNDAESYQDFLLTTLTTTFDSKVSVFNNIDPEYVDIVMTFFPMFAVTYLTLLQEYVNFHALMSIYFPRDGFPPSTCENLVQVQKYNLDQMANNLEHYRNTIVSTRREKIELVEEVLEERGYTFPIVRVEDGDENILLELRNNIGNKALAQEVLEARRNEVEWALNHFGKYDLSTIGSLIVAVRNETKIIKTCQDMKDNEAFRNDYIDIGLITSNQTMPGNDVSCPVDALPIAYAQVDFSNPNAPYNSPFTLNNTQIVESAPGNVPRALRITGDDQFAMLLGVDISPSKMKHCTLVMSVYLETIANDFGWAASHDNGGFDRGIALHDVRGSGMSLMQGSAGKVYPEYTPAPTKKWIQVIAIYRQGGTCEFWLDGTKAPITLNGNNDDSGLPDLSIGTASSHGNHFMDGWIKEVQVFDRALNSLEVDSLYNKFRSEVDGESTFEEADRFGFASES